MQKLYWINLSIILRFLFISAASFSLVACNTILKDSRDAAEIDYDINSGARRIDRHMEHYQG